MLSSPSSDVSVTARQLITSCLQSSNLWRDLLNILIKSVGSTSVPSFTLLDLLVDGLDRFMEFSFTGCIYRAISSLECPGSIDSSLQSPPTLNLGDTVEANIDSVWRKATVVRVDVVGETCTVEYSSRQDESPPDDQQPDEEGLDDEREVQEIPSAKLVTIPLQAEFVRKPTSRAGPESALSQFADFHDFINRVDLASSITGVMFQLNSMQTCVELQRDQYCMGCCGDCKARLSIVFCKDSHCIKCKQYITGISNQSPFGATSSNLAPHFAWQCASCHALSCLDCIPVAVPAVYRTLCLLGGSSEKVRASPSPNSKIVGELSLGCSVDVIDRVGLEYFELVGNRVGFVRKQSIHGGVLWRELPQDRYTAHEDYLGEHQLVDTARPDSLYQLSIANMKYVLEVITMYIALDEAIMVAHHSQGQELGSREGKAQSEVDEKRMAFLRAAMSIFEKVCIDSKDVLL